MSFRVETNESHRQPQGKLSLFHFQLQKTTQGRFKLRYQKVTGYEKLFAIAPCWKLSLYISLNSSFNNILALSVEIVQLNAYIHDFFFLFLKPLLLLHNSTKHYLQCKTHYATLLTEQYLRYLQCRLLMLAIQYWIWLLTKNIITCNTGYLHH